MVIMNKLHRKDKNGCDYKYKYVGKFKAYVKAIEYDNEKWIPLHIGSTVGHFYYKWNKEKEVIDESKEIELTEKEILGIGGEIY